MSRSSGPGRGPASSQLFLAAALGVIAVVVVWLVTKIARTPRAAWWVIAIGGGILLAALAVTLVMGMGRREREH